MDRDVEDNLIENSIKLSNVILTLRLNNLLPLNDVLRIYHARDQLLKVLLVVTLVDIVLQVKQGFLIVAETFVRLAQLDVFDLRFVVVHEFIQLSLRVGVDPVL